MLIKTLFSKILRTVNAFSIYIEDYSWARMGDEDIFALHLTGRPNDEGARSARKVQLQIYSDLERVRLEEF